jgi:hypothetical protein
MTLENFSKEDMILKTQKFYSTEESEMDYRIYERIFSGRMTKRRYKIIESFCRRYTYRPYYNCGHEYDCCGCFCGQNMSFTYKQNQVVIRFTQSFNY